MNKQQYGRKDSYRDDRDREVENKVQYVKKQFNGYYKATEIRNILTQCNNDTNECIRIFNEKYKNSWVNILSSGTLPPIQPLPQRNDIKSEPIKNNKETISTTSSQKNLSSQNTRDVSSQQSTSSQNTQSNQQSSSQNTQSSQQSSNQNTRSETKSNKNKKRETDTTTTSTNTNTQNVQKNVTQQPPTQKSNQTDGLKDSSSNELRPSDFEYVEKSLHEKQVQLNKEANELNQLMGEIKNLKEKKQTKFSSLVKEKEHLEQKKKEIHEEYNIVCSALNEKEQQIQNLEREFNTSFSELQKKAERFQLKLYPQ